MFLALVIPVACYQRMDCKSQLIRSMDFAIHQILRALLPRTKDHQNGRGEKYMISHRNEPDTSPALAKLSIVQTRTVADGKSCVRIEAS